MNQAVCVCVLVVLQWNPEVPVEAGDYIVLGTQSLPQRT